MPATFFEVFGLAPAVDLDLVALERTFRELSLQFHPDRLASTADARERRIALEQTTRLNEGFKALKDPTRRAFYLLKLVGPDLDRDDASAAQRAMPLEFLEEVIELREALETLKSAKDLAGAQKMAEGVRARQEAALNEARAALTTRLAQPNAEEAVTTATQALSRVRYFARFLEEVERMEDEALS